MKEKKYFIGESTVASTAVRIFLVLLFVFAMVFFLWSMMKYNEIMEEKKENESYIEQLGDEVSRLQYLVDAPLDDAYKIRVAREKLGMCFPDEIVFYSEME